MIKVLAQNHLKNGSCICCCGYKESFSLCANGREFGDPNRSWNEVYQMVSNSFYFLGPLLYLIVNVYLIELVFNDREKTRGIADSRTSVTIVLHLQWKY